MQTNNWCKSRFFISDATAFYQDVDAKYPYDAHALLGICHDANVPLWVYHDTNALMQTQFIQKFLLFSKWGFPNAWNQNIFKLNLLFLKSHLPFDLKLPKNWWSLLENLWMGHLLEIWWIGSKDLSPQFGQAKRWRISEAFSGKMNTLKI